jgi:hypothetical protein
MSSVVVQVRRKAFEKKFQEIILEGRKRRTRNGSAITRPQSIQTIYELPLSTVNDDSFIPERADGDTAEHVVFSTPSAADSLGKSLGISRSHSQPITQYDVGSDTSRPAQEGVQHPKPHTEGNRTPPDGSSTLERADGDTAGRIVFSAPSVANSPGKPVATYWSDRLA